MFVLRSLKVSAFVRRGAIAIVAVLLAVCSIAAAQVSVKHGSHPQSPTGERVPPSPPPGARITTVKPEPTTSPRSTARVTTVCPSTDGQQFLFPYWGLGGAFAGYAPLWSYDVSAIPVQAGLPLENAMIGGLQLDFDPRGAQVYVDGTHTGVVSDFSGYYKHLELVAGPHLVTLLAQNYEPLTISVMVTPGHTTTYRGTLTRAHGR